MLYRQSGAFAASYAALGIEPGPRLGELLAAIAEEAFSGELRSAQDAVAFAASRIA